MRGVLSEEQRDALRGIEQRLTEALVSVRDLQRRDCSLAARRELQLVVTALQQSWGWLQFAEWELAGLDGFPQAERPWGPIPAAGEEPRRGSIGGEVPDPRVAPDGKLWGDHVADLVRAHAKAVAREDVVTAERLRAKLYEATGKQRKWAPPKRAEGVTA